MAEKLFEAFDFIFVFAVTNHQVVVFFSNDQVIDALNDDIFSGRNVHNTVVRIVKHHFIRIGDIVVVVFITKGVKSMPGTDVRPAEIPF